ncbi:MAG: MFS transporter [Myxococcota bacterium]|nr:MFS transporter [Myxococcota bacterium]
MRTLPSSFWLLSFSSFLFFCSFSMLTPLLPDFMKSFGAEGYLGLHITVFTLAALLSRPFSGKLTDQWGRIPVMIIGACITAFFSFLYPFLPYITAFLILRFLHGFSTGFTPTGTSAYVTDVLPENMRGLGMGVLSFFGMSGMGMGNFIGGELALHWSLSTIFYTSSVLAVVSIGAMLGLKETLEDRKTFHPTMLKISTRDLYEPTVWVPFVAMALVTFPFGVVLTLSPDFSELLHIPNKGLYFVYFTVTSLISRVGGGMISDRYGRRIVSMASMLLVTVGMLVTGAATTAHVLLGGALLFGFGYGLGVPNIFAWTADLSDESIRGRAFATVFIALEIGIGAGALLAGQMFQGSLQSIALPFYSAGLLTLLGFFFLLVKKPQPNNHKNPNPHLDATVEE